MGIFTLITTGFKKKLLIIVVVLLFIMSNPTIADFNSFAKANKYDLEHSGRANYLLFFSIFKTYDGQTNFTYLGVFKNFIKIKEG